MTYDPTCRYFSPRNAEKRIKKEIYGQLQSGKDFAAMAREFSQKISIRLATAGKCHDSVLEFEHSRVWVGSF
jgi:hypothetical protein